MPSGVYPRTPNQLLAAKANLAKGRAPAARAKAAVTLKSLVTPAWRAKVSKATRKAMRQPAIRKRHLTALAGRPVNFRGGNGQPPLPLTLRIAELLAPLGFIAEFPIKTAGHGTGHKAPTSYKVDFGHQGLCIAVELDGPSHRPRAQQMLDNKKTEVLRALGWEVLRLQHK